MKSSESSKASAPTVLVAGAGAIGGFYGAKLAQAGARASVVCRSDYEAVKADGIRIAGASGAYHFHPDQVVARASDYQGVPDYLLVALKVLPDIDVAKLVAPAVGSATTVVLLQNGVEIEPPLARAFPRNEIASGLAFVCVSRSGPGRIHHQDFGRLTLGLYPRGRSAKVDRLAELFEQAGIPCVVTEDAVAARWQKLVWNAPFNPMSVLGHHADTRAMLDHPPSASLVRQVMTEVESIARAAGHPLPESVIDRNIRDTSVMKPYKTSMLLDFEAGRPMEVEAILGNAVRAARREGVEAPRLETLYALLSLADERNRQG